jgi:hypothetical protein
MDDDGFVMERVVPLCAVLSIALFTISMSAVLFALAYRVVVDGLDGTPTKEPARAEFHQT